MLRFLVFAGTTEGRQAVELLARQTCELVACTATEYGGESLLPHPNLEVLSGRMDRAEMERFLRERRFDCVLDATHPYAVEASRNIRGACQAAGTQYLRVLRAGSARQSCTCVESAAAAAEYLCGVPGRVLLTTGSKELDAFTRVPDYRERLFPRVLSNEASLRRCLELGFPARNIICMQGPFSEELNLAMLRQVGASVLVTKESGGAGGFLEKCHAARRAGAELVVIGRPEEPVPGVLAEDLPVELERRFGLVFPASRRESMGLFPLFVDLAGKKAVVVGGGWIASRRVNTLLGFGCSVLVIAPEASQELRQEAERGEIEWQGRVYRPGDCRGAVLAVAATGDREANHAVAAECAALGVPVSVADRREECTFQFPGVVREGSVTIGVNAGGTDHHLAREVTENIRRDRRRLIPQKEGRQP